MERKLTAIFSADVKGYSRLNGRGASTERKRIVMNIKIEIPQSVEALTEFVQFYDQVYKYRAVCWPATVEFEAPVLKGGSNEPDSSTPTGSA